MTTNAGVGSSTFRFFIFAKHSNKFAREFVYQRTDGKYRLLRKNRIDAFWW